MLISYLKKNIFGDFQTLIIVGYIGNILKVFMSLPTK
jgi:hypothetical protein